MNTDNPLLAIMQACLRREPRLVNPVVLEAERKARADTESDKVKSVGWTCKDDAMKAALKLAISGKW